MNVTMKLEGFAELDAILAALPSAVARRVLPRAVRAGSAVYRTAVRARAPRSERGYGIKMKAGGVRYPGFLRRQIRIMIPRINGAQVRAGVGIGRAFYAMFLERGTRHMAARPFFRAAVDTSHGPALKVMRDAIGNGIVTEVTRNMVRARMR